MPTIVEIELLEPHDDHLVMRATLVTTVQSSTMDTPQGPVELLEGDMIQSGTVTWFFDSANPEASVRSKPTRAFVETVEGERITAEVHQRMEITSTLHG